MFYLVIARWNTRKNIRKTQEPDKRVAPQTRFELATFSLGGRRAIHCATRAVHPTPTKSGLQQNYTFGRLAGRLLLCSISSVGSSIGPMSQRSWVRSPHGASFCWCVSETKKPTKSGEAGYRSLCLVHAKHALCHLSYIPDAITYVCFDYSVQNQ